MASEDEVYRLRALFVGFAEGCTSNFRAEVSVIEGAI